MSPVQPPAPNRILLVADDFALSKAITNGIERLAAARRISGTSAIVTETDWPSAAKRLASLRDRIAIGLHFNLSEGRPLTTMPRLAPGTHFTGLAPLLKLSLASTEAARAAAHEARVETTRQLEAFETATGYPPDFIDGHQHVHALRVIRDGFLAALAERFGNSDLKPLVRVPSAGAMASLVRGRATPKALLLAALSSGLARAVKAAGFPANDDFAGVSSFSATPAAVAADFAAAVGRRRGLNLVMCHPGLAETEASSSDTLAARRPLELVYLENDNALSAKLWRPNRPADGPPIDWRT
ncbi:MAG: ChbG/HpnK family deacetylase [Hyphomicrobiaceae bacterium]